MNSNLSTRLKLVRKIVIFLCILTSGLLCVYWMALGKQRTERKQRVIALQAKLESIPTATNSKPLVVPPPSIPQTGTSLADLPFLGKALSDPQSLGKELEQLRKVIDAVETNLSEDGKADYTSIMVSLGHPRPANEQEALAAFVKLIETFKPLLAKINADLSLEGWPWPSNGNAMEKAKHLTAIAPAIMSAVKFCDYASEAYQISGDAGSARELINTARKAELRMSEGNSMMAFLLGSGLSSHVLRMEQKGILRNTTTDAELRELLTSAPISAREKAQRALAGEMETINAMRANPSEVRQNILGTGGQNALLGFITDITVSNADIADSIDLSVLDISVAAANARAGIYAPSKSNEQPKQDQWWFEQFLPNTLQRNQLEGSGRLAEVLVKSAVQHEASDEILRIQAALELNRRSTGSFPTSLPDVSSYFPENQLPIDPITAKPFSYELVNDGKNYRLWSWGLDHVNQNGGEETDDIGVEN